MALVTWYSTGTVSVEGGSTTVTGANLFWGDDAIMPGDLFCDPAQPLVPPQRVREVTADNTLELWAPWPGATIADAPYEIRFVGIIERSTAQTRRVLEQLGDVKAWADMFVEDDAARLALDTASNPLRSGVRVLVVDEGMIWQKASGAYGDWIGPAEFKGDKGDKGWAPQLAGETSGARRVLKLIGYTGGQGTPPTANVGKYLKGDGSFTDVIVEAMDIRGPAGDINGVTPFWQGRITVDTDANAARDGLGLAKQSSIDDTAAGRVLTVGAFGLGGSSLPILDWDNADINGALYTGFNAANAPISGDLLGQSHRYSADYGVLLVFQPTGSTPRIFSRIENDGVWQPWAEVFHTRNTIGSVSQSSGVPTGALSTGWVGNANGWYKREADGTQEVLIVGKALTTSPNTIALPASFIDTDYVVTSTHVSSFSEAVTVVRTYDRLAASFTAIMPAVINGGGGAVAPASGTVDFNIKGRWF